MNAPHRIQLRRTKGWRLPPGAVSVARPTRWGNPWRVGTGEIRVIAPMLGAGAGEFDPHDLRLSDGRLPGLSSLTPQMVVDLYREDLLENLVDADPYFDDLRERLALLRGKDLACWCPLDQPCHADVLLAVANEERS